MRTKVVVALCIIAVAAMTCFTAPVPATDTNNLNIQIKIKTEEHANIDIWLNSINLDDEIDELYSKYQALSAYMQTTDANIITYITLTEIKTRLIDKHQEMISLLHQKLAELANTDANETAKQKLVEEIKKHQQQINKLQQQTDQRLIQVLMNYEQKLRQKDVFAYNGWHDRYGEFHHFKEQDDWYLNRDFIFRITNCYSDLGVSKVLQNGELTVEGYANVRAITNEELIFKLVDPYETKIKTLMLGEHAENKTLNDCELTWNEQKFTFKLKANLKPGMKQLDIAFRNATISVSFDVVKPNIELLVPPIYNDTPFYIGVLTNLPDKVIVTVKANGTEQTKDAILVNGRALAFFDGVTGKITIIAKGTNGYEWVVKRTTRVTQ